LSIVRLLSEELSERVTRSTCTLSVGMSPTDVDRVFSEFIDARCVRITPIRLRSGRIAWSAPIFREMSHHAQKRDAAERPKIRTFRPM
jgi:hypothetical protein